MIKLKIRLTVYENTFKNSVSCCTSLLKDRGFSPFERLSNVVSGCVQNTGVNWRSLGPILLAALMAHRTLAITSHNVTSWTNTGTLLFWIFIYPRKGDQTVTTPCKGAGTSSSLSQQSMMRQELTKDMGRINWGSYTSFLRSYETVKTKYRPFPKRRNNPTRCSKPY